MANDQESEFGVPGTPTQPEPQYDLSFGSTHDSQGEIYPDWVTNPPSEDYSDDIDSELEDHQEHREQNREMAKQIFSESIIHPDLPKFLENVKSSNRQGDILKNSPSLVDDVSELPGLFKSILGGNHKQEVKDIMLMGSLIGCGSTMPNVSMRYGSGIICPNLFGLILGPAASDKSVLSAVSELTYGYHKHLLERSKCELASLSANKTGNLNQYMLHIPDNITQAAIVQQLHTNQGRGMMYGTELDTLVNSLKSQYGHFSEFLRKSYCGDKYTKATKVDGIIEIESPYLGVCLAGTLNQLPKLISNAEDGLLSRFCFYFRKENVVFVNPLGHSKQDQSVSIKEQMISLSEKYKNYCLFLEKYPTKVTYSKKQEKHFNKIGKEITHFLMKSGLSEYTGIGYRLLEMHARICMVFSALRKAETENKAANIEITNEDYHLACKLIKVFFLNSMKAFSIIKPFSKDLLAQLPMNFTHKNLEDLASTKDFGSIRTLERKVDELIDQGKVIKTSHGNYEKIIS